LGIVTNGSVASQSAKLVAMGLHDLVDLALISEQEQVKKPDPIIFKRAAERLKVPVADCIFVGDHARTDIEGAHNAGLKTVWFKRGHEWPADLTTTPNYTVSSLFEVLALKF
jgi:putative hydrolase of the HAD superfamily